MKALKITLTSNVANYKKEETIDHKTTYPLPPYSTVIGAIHNACGYMEYHPMNISIQGSFGSMGKKEYTYHWFLDNVMTDRDILVKIYDSNHLSNSYKEVASIFGQKEAFNPIINSDEPYSIDSFTNAKIHDEELAFEYIELKKLQKRFALEEKEVFKPKIAELKAKVKDFTKAIREAKEKEEKDKLKEEQNAIKVDIKALEDERKAYKEMHIDKPLSLYKTLNKSLKSYELLYDVKLVLHIQSDDETIECIKENIYNLTSIGRREDFVEVKEIKEVTLTKDFDVVKSKNSFYIDVNEIDDAIEISPTKGIKKHGTVYYLNKTYTIQDNKRVFNKKKVLYCSNIEAYGQEQGNIYLDDDKMIVNLV